MERISWFVPGRAAKYYDAAARANVVPSAWTNRSDAYPG
jgi:hypothetical protein